MEVKIQQKIKEKIKKIKDSPGVYFFLGDRNKILYIGKATSLKSRVRSYFTPDIVEKRSPLIGRMIEIAKNLKTLATDSVLEALILEANLIKKYRPEFNTAEKDQKSWNYVVITNEEFPRIIVVRERELIMGAIDYDIKEKFGPYVHTQELREALKIVRKIFPYGDSKCKPLQGRPCFNRQIGLCPGVCTGEVSKSEYAKTIKHIKLFFEGKKGVLISSLKKEMSELAKKRNFEEAEKIKRKIFSIQHIHDIALLKNNAKSLNKESGYRIESYDIAHISGTSVVGVMTVVQNGEIDKNEYRKFKISVERNNDTAALREVLNRRLKHSEWKFPDLIVVDGGEAQLNTAKTVLEAHSLSIPVVGVVKDSRHKPVDIRGSFAKERRGEILLANSESHRFAITYHRKLRGMQI